MRDNDGLLRASPESLGVKSEDILAFFNDCSTSKIELNSFMLYKGGKVVSEAWWWPYRAELQHSLHSATKSFLSVAVGLAVDEGFFRLDDKVVGFFPDRPPAEPSANLLSMTVEDLLTQTSGHGHGVSGGEWREIETSWIDTFFSIEVEHVPGSNFVYSSANSFMLSAIISKTTGLSARDFLEPRLFRPLGIKMLSWDVGPEGINPGGNGISCLASDFLKLGILHMQKGVWDGRQILPVDYVASATQPQRGNPHGYHWWTNSEGQFWAGGMFGQLCIVFPKQDAVVVTTAAVGRGAVALRDLIWRHFPRMFSSSPCIAASSECVELETRISKLSLLEPFQTGLQSTNWLSLVSQERYVAGSNEDGIVSFVLDFSQPKSCAFHLQDGRGFHRVLVGLDDYIEGETTLSGARLHHGYEPARLRVVAGGRWTSKESFKMVLQYNETVFRDTITVTFDEDYHMAKLDRSVNVNSFSTKRPAIWGVILITPESVKKLQCLPSSVAYSTAATTIGELLDSDATRAILEAEIPEVVKNPRIEKARRYTFDLILHHIPELTMQDLARIDAKLSLL